MKKIVLYLIILIPIINFAQTSPGRLNLSNIKRQTASGTITIQFVGLPTFYGKNGTATPSQSCNYTFAGSSIGTSGAIASATGVQYSINGGSTWVSSVSGISAGSGTLLVRGASATGNGTYGPENIVFSASGATSRSCSITLIVSSANPGIFLSPTSNTLPSTVAGTQGSSLSWTVTGINLTQTTYTVTAPSNVLISPDNVNFSSSYTISNIGGGISATTFGALSSGAAAGTYSGFVTYTASDISGVQDTVSGTVTSSGGGIDSVVAQFVLDSSTQSISGWTDVAGDPHAAIRTATDSRNWQPVGISSVATTKWVGIGTGNKAASNTLGNFSTLSQFAGVGKTYWYNSISGGSSGGVWNGWVAGNENIYLSGLNPSLLYNVQVFSSTTVGSCGSANSTIYLTDSTNARVDSATISVKGNTTIPAIFKNKKPDASGIIRLAVMPIAGGTNVNCGQYGFGNAIIVTKQATREGFDSPCGIILALGLLIGLVRKRKRQLGTIIFLSMVLCRPSIGNAQSETNNFTTYDTIIPYQCLCNAYDGCTLSGVQQYWVVRISRPVNYFTAGNADTASRPVLFTMQGDGEVSNGTYTFLNHYGPHYWLANGWNGSVQLGNGTHYPLLITIQANATNLRPVIVQQLLDTLFKEFHPRSIHMAALSGGVEVLGWYMMYEQTTGNEHNMANIKSFVDMMGVSPDNNISLNCGTIIPYVAGFGYWAHKYGGRFFGIEGSNDTRNIWQITESMNDSVPNSAYFTYDNDDGGSHCCWNDFYNPAVTNWQNVTIPYGNTMISSKSGTPNTIGNYSYVPSTGTNLFQWMLRQGDTTLVGGCAPLVSAGNNQTIQLPTNSATVTGSVTYECGASSSTHAWSQISGPNTATISAPSSFTTNFTGLIAGTYVFQINLTDNNAGTGQSNVTITVLQEQSPTVSAGSGGSIQLPNSAFTLNGSANANGGANIPSNDTTWTQISGPAAATISNPSNTATSVSAMNVSGSYVFQLSVTDNNGNSAHSQVTVVVVPSGTVNVRPVTIVGPGEYQTFLINKAGQITAIGDNLATMGVGGIGTVGLPLPIVGAPGVTLPPFKNVFGGLHGGCAIDSSGDVYCGGDNANGTLGQGNNSTYNYFVQITRDSAGNPFTNVVYMSSIYVGGSNGSQGWTAIKSDHTLWIWGQLAGGARLNGTDSTHADSTTYYPVQVTIPGGRLAQKVQGGQIIIVLATDGTVWAGCRPGFTQDLGYAWTGTQYQTLHQIASGAADIAGGGGFNYYIDSSGFLHGWGSYGTCLGGAGSSGRGTPIATPTLLTALQSHYDAPIAQIGVNAVATYVLTTSGSFYAHGDNAQGNIGIGSETNFNDSSSTQKPYAWNFGTVNIPVQYPVKILSGIEAFFTSQPFLFYTYAEDSSGNLYSWGRNKGCVLGNGVVPCSANNSATYPNAWDVTSPTAIYPYNLLYSITVWCPWCNLYPSVTPCNQCTPATNGAPLVTISGGNTQNINASSVSITSSATPATGIKLSSVLWGQVSGPTTAINSSPPTAATTFSNLSAGTYVFSVVWTDQNDKSTTQNVSVIVSGETNCHCYVFPDGSVLGIGH